MGRIERIFVHDVRKVAQKEINKYHSGDEHVPLTITDVVGTNTEPGFVYSETPGQLIWKDADELAHVLALHNESSVPTTTTIDGVTHLKTTTVVIDNDNNITTPGDITCSQVHSISDARVKKIISEEDITLEDVNRLRQVKFIVNGTHKTRIGVVAQQINDIFPECVSEVGNNGLLAVDYEALAVVGIAGIKKLSQKVDELEKRIKTMEDKWNETTSPSWWNFYSRLRSTTESQK